MPTNIRIERLTREALGEPHAKELLDSLKEKATTDSAFKSGGSIANRYRQDTTGEGGTQAPLPSRP